jgi:hypothetical protein
MKKTIDFINSIYEEGELAPEATVKKYLTVEDKTFLLPVMCLIQARRVVEHRNSIINSYAALRHPVVVMLWLLLGTMIYRHCGKTVGNDNVRDHYFTRNRN